MAQPKQQDLLVNLKRLLDAVTSRGDLSAALLTGWSSFAVYFYTLQPNVGLEDSGEFITAAVHLGVPHPPGYPLWTVISWLFTSLIPFGNVAWRVNLVSAVFGALAVGVFTWLAAHAGRWMLSGIQEVEDSLARRLSWIGAVAAGGVLAFSDAMWSQAVIAEVYTLNAFILSLVLYSFYRWFRDPAQELWLVGTAFFIAVGMTNHHTLFFIFPALFIGVYLARPGFEKVALPKTTEGGQPHEWSIRPCAFWDFCIACFVISATVLYYFCHLSQDKEMLKIGERASTAALVVAGIIAFLVNFKVSLKLVGGALVATWLGLLIYAYMPLASKTNPPMNWGYASEQSGFFHAVNRGQYGDNLATLIKGKVGPLLGVPTKAAPEAGHPLLDKVLPHISSYFASLADNISFPVIFFALCILMYVGHYPKGAGNWIWFLLAAFMCLAFLFPLAGNDLPSFDLQSLWVGKVFNLQSQCVFALFLGFGIALGLLYLHQTVPEFPRAAAWVMLALPAIPFALNYHGCEQRDRWFGWMYGTDSLRNCERDAVVFGGTDPGRFVTTYAIFCESTQDNRWKRDPSFDRRDLYVITQNALADRTYMKYIRSHYDVSRRAEYGPFEKWLGRDRIYPKQPLNLPTEEEVSECFEEYVKSGGASKEDGSRVVVEGLEGVFAINANISQLIFEKNKARHTFYVEESYPMDWYYPHAIPDGLFLKLAPEPLKDLPPGTVEKDRAYWDAYAAKLLENPKFLNDRPARMSFSKLRCSIGNIYARRKLLVEAEYAYRQAVVLAPQNTESVFRLVELLMDQDRYDEADQAARAFQAIDTYNTQVVHVIGSIKEKRNVTSRRAELMSLLDAKNISMEERIELMTLHGRLRENAELSTLLTESLKQTNLTTEHLQSIATLCAQLRLREPCMETLVKWHAMEPSNAAVAYDLGMLKYASGNTKDALVLLGKAADLGGGPIRKVMSNDQRLAPLMTNEALRKAIGSLPPTNRQDSGKQVGTQLP